MRFLIQMTVFGFRLAPILLIVYWVLLFTGTHLPGAALQGVKANDKLLHFLAFSGLAFLLAWSLPRYVFGRIPGLLIAAAIVLTYAAVDEWTQGFVPRRNPDVADFFADSLGMLVGFTTYLILRGILLRSSLLTRESEDNPPTTVGPSAVNRV